MSSSKQPNHPYALQSSEELEAWKKQDDKNTIALAKISAAGVIAIVALFVIMMWILSTYSPANAAGLLTLVR